jgi:hypothetical protein
VVLLSSPTIHRAVSKPASPLGCRKARTSQPGSVGGCTYDASPKSGVSANACNASSELMIVLN